MHKIKLKTLIIIFGIIKILILWYILAPSTSHNNRNKPTTTTNNNNNKKIISDKNGDDVGDKNKNIIKKSSSSSNGSRTGSNEIKSIPEIVIAVVACGMRLQETLTMLKSAIIFNTDRIPLKFIIVTEEQLMLGFKEKLEDWLVLTKNGFTFELLPLAFPIKNEKEWKTLFKPCAAQRLFLPTLLKDIDSILYLDTDTVFLSPVLEIWQFFAKFNASQMAGLSPEHEDRNVGWYNRFARHPYYKPLGVNSGVMLMNLTRMRAFRWEEYILPLHREYKLKITWGDQDLINILFSYHPDKLYVFPCQFNYRPDHCMYMSVCKSPNGIQILHGNRGYFHGDKQPAFSQTYKYIEEYQLGTDLYRNFVLPLDAAMADDLVTKSNCGKISDKFLIRAKELFKESEYYYS